MKIGAIVPLAALQESKWEDEFKFLRENKFNHAELMCDHPFFAPINVTNKQIMTIKELANSYEIEMIMHAPFTHVNLGDTTKQFVEHGFKEMQAAMKVANKLEIQFMTIHGPYQGFVMDLVMKSYKQNFEKLLKIANTHEVLLGFENMPRGCDSLPQELKHFIFAFREMLKSRYADNLKITYDVGHANTMGMPTKYLMGIVKEFGREVVHDLHIADNQGIYDDHISVGDGTIDFKEFMRFLRKLDYDKYFTIELDVVGKGFEKRLKSVQRIRDIQRKLE
jgi:sugar phosphate isomerase/epimerase